MMRLGRVWVSLGVALLSASLFGQTPPNSTPQLSFDQYLQEHPWDPTASGPMMVVDPASSTGPTGTSDISGFKRQAMPCGSLTTLAPNSMVVLDGSLNAPIDFFDGLTRRDKVLFLMSTLSDGQWRLAAGRGLGLGDVSGQQRAVFQSIVPSSLGAIYSRISPDGFSLIPVERKQFSPNDLAAMRLHFCRELAVQVRHGEGGGFFTEYGNVQDRHSPGEIVVLPDGIIENESTSVFGIAVRKIAPNFLKRSDLYYDGAWLNPSLKLPTSCSVGELLDKISSLVGMSLKADARVAGRPVFFFGDSARAGDVLKALAMSVTGTFRKVGVRYLLTSDIIGLGTRQVAVSAYAENQERTLNAKRVEWRNTTSRAGSVKYVGYSPTDSLAPTASAKNWIEAHGDAPSQDTISSDVLAPNWRTVLQRTNTASDRPPDLDNLKLAERIRWNFILPDGALLEWGGSFPISLLRPEEQAMAATPALGAFNSDARRSDLVMALILKFEDAQTGTAMLSQVKGFNPSEVWLQTSNPMALRAVQSIASQTGIKSRLFIRPWEFGQRSNAQTLELNILGDNPMQAAQRQFRAGVWSQLAQLFGTPTREPSPIISPIADEVQGRWTAFRGLSGMTGLEGVVIADSEPPGYEPFRYSGDNDLLGAGIASMADLGYTDQERLQFLDKFGVDPVDLVQDAEMVPIDFSVPMFSGSVSSAPDLLDAWDRLRSANNLSQTEALLDMISAPILIEPRRYTKHLVPSGVTFVEPLFPGRGIPHSDPIYDLGGVELGDGIPVFKISSTPSPGEIAFNKKNLAAPRRRNLVAFDLTGIPIMNLKGVLAPYLPPVSSPLPADATPTMIQFFQEIAAKP